MRRNTAAIVAAPFWKATELIFDLTDRLYRHQPPPPASTRAPDPPRDPDPPPALRSSRLAFVEPGTDLIRAVASDLSDIIPCGVEFHIETSFNIEFLRYDIWVRLVSRPDPMGPPEERVLRVTVPSEQVRLMGYAAFRVEIVRQLRMSLGLFNAERLASEALAK